jgi:RNA polymerase sigma factor (TIGR02999 family)
MSDRVTDFLNGDTGPSGDSDALSRRLAPLVYESLRSIARRRIRSEAPQTLESAELVHETFLRLVKLEAVRWRDRRHFYGAAAATMRRILVDRARRKLARRHGGGLSRAPLDPDETSTGCRPDEVLELDRLIDHLGELDPRKGAVVRLRYFVGLSVVEVAGLLGVSPATVKNDWAYAKAWLHRGLSQAENGSRPRGTDDD